eukprot:CAMPEP_0172486068 /NCGR_PEP_ID=MMETSP1066-20121228/14452_1 /TAXON_ID=671091 /ORGANISM="Coscinodiscus wailesii, Strain CCMP2513" /LENGTH=230 /DNA_ID=CAMNT_0013251777 /DNA_START=78 /DNA_END=770 /DNA_ORIENTATION=-
MQYTESKQDTTAVVSDDERDIELKVSNKRPRFSSSQNLHVPNKKRTMCLQDASTKCLVNENEVPMFLPILPSCPSLVTYIDPSAMLRGIYFDNCDLSSFSPDTSALMDPSFMLQPQIAQQGKCLLRKQQQIARPLDFPSGYLRQVPSQQQPQQVNNKERSQYTKITHFVHKPRQLEDNATITKDNCVPDIDDKSINVDKSEESQKAVTSSLMDVAIILSTKLPNYDESLN